jgi:tetratricopeptide (TPR) repeat protein
VIVPALQPQSQPKTAQPQPTRPQPQPVQPQPPAPRVSVEVMLADADRAINSGDLAAARSLYRAIVDAPQLTHANALRAAEGAYRSRDFATAVRAFQRAGSIGKGEEQYHYYYAVALYENGLYADAKRELHAALPYIEVTPDVARYQSKIDGAIE